MSFPENSYLLRLVPLGGLGEIGLNMMVFETPEDIIVVDSGLMFPEEYMLGIDYVIPDARYIYERKQKLRAIVLTHGHEDHIGALSYLMKELSCPIYGTPMTLGLVRHRLSEHGLLETTDLRVIEPRKPFQTGGMKIEPIRVSHSIVDGVGLAIETPAGIIVHTGDFKIDKTPVDGQAIDLAAFARFGEHGVTLLLSDSTNIENEGYTLSEREVGKVFDEIFANSPGRIILAAFASNIHRIQQAIDSAARFQRKVIVSGRSMADNIRIAMELGYLHVPADIMVDINELPRLYPAQVCMLTTGSQGEPLSALTRMAYGDHKQVQIQPGDTVILSSKFIPGNELSIQRIINQLYRRGAEVYYEKVSEIHVSGHASREELALMISLVKPQYFIPIHGETRHLIQHARLAEHLGIPPENVIVAHDGDVVEFRSDGVHKMESVEVGRVFIDGKGVGDVEDVVLRDRKHLSENGMVIAIMVIKAHTGEIVYGPDISTRGVTFEEIRPDLLPGAKDTLAELLANITPEIKLNVAELKAEVHRVLRKYFNRELDRRPVILPLIIEL